MYNYNEMTMGNFRYLAISAAPDTADIIDVVVHIKKDRKNDFKTRK